MNRERITYKLAYWDPRSFTFVDGKIAYPTQEAARLSATKPGLHRTSEISNAGRIAMVSHFWLKPGIL